MYIYYTEQVRNKSMLIFLNIILFRFSLMEPGDNAVSLSLDDLEHFAPPLGGGSLPGTHDHSFDDGAASFLSGTDLSHDAFDLVGGDNTSDGFSRRTPSIAG